MGLRTVTKTLTTHLASRCQLGSDVALFEIPTSSQFTWYTMPINLTGQQYNFELRLNTRMERWILNILDQVLNPILLGIPLLINRSLIGQYTTLAIPQGVMYCVDESGAGLEPVLSSFLTSHALLYFDAQP